MICFKGEGEKKMAVQTEIKESSSNLHAYLSQIRQDRLLTAEEEKALSRRILQGDEFARKSLINSNLRLVVKIARGYLTHDMELLDLIQEGNLGLIKAAEKFDFRKNVRFSTYASFWIKQSIARALSNKSRMIRLPHRKEEKLRKITKATQRFSKLNGRTPDAEELSCETKLDEHEIRNIMNLPEKVLSIESSDGGESYALKNVIQDSKYDPDYIVMRKYLREKTAEMLEILTEKERQVLLNRYAFINGRKYTLKDIGEKLSISPETVRQVEIKALKKIREHFSHLKELLWD
jgi:RNA polymerase primary sigma factor